MNPFINEVASKETIELLGKFFESASNAIRKSNYNPEIVEAFDLIQAISCYRYFPSVDLCIEAFPNLAADKHKVEYIWNQFAVLDNEQLSDIFISSISKLHAED